MFQYHQLDITDFTGLYNETSTCYGKIRSLGDTSDESATHVTKRSDHSNRVVSAKDTEVMIIGGREG